MKQARLKERRVYTYALSLIAEHLRVTFKESVYA